MCGRFFLATPIDAIAELFGIGHIEINWQPRYNIAPTQDVPVIRAEDHLRTLSLLRWGLIPSWADAPSIGSRMINARAESAPTKPAFRKAFANRRCIIPADGFFEWKKLGPRTKQPMAIVSADAAPLAMAGLWERWRQRDKADAPWLETCTILTCEPNEPLRDIHDRMPVLLSRDDIETWLTTEDPVAARELLRPLPGERLRIYPVGGHINSPRNDDPRCIEEIRPQDPLGSPAGWWL